VRSIAWGGAGYDELYLITKDLLQNKNSNTLEIVVIILILVEVINIFIRQ